jgi:hypothetical protein
VIAVLHGGAGRLAAAAIAIGLLAGAGCGKPETGEVQLESKPDAGLQDLKAFLTSAKASGQATTRAAAAPVIGGVHLAADYYLGSGQIVFLWGAQLSDEADAAGRIIAYQRTAPSDGGWVLFQDGSLREISAEAFAAAEKAEP